MSIYYNDELICAIERGKEENMARGPKKSLDDKINEKYSIIEALKIRIKSEQAELDELLKEKQNKEIEELGNVLKDSNLSAEDARRILEDYITKNTQQTA